MSDTTNKTFKTLYQGRRITVAFAWFDLWVGFYIDYTVKRLYFCPVPMLIFSIDYGKQP